MLSFGEAVAIARAFPRAEPRRCAGHLLFGVDGRVFLTLDRRTGRAALRLPARERLLLDDDASLLPVGTDAGDAWTLVDLGAAETGSFRQLVEIAWLSVVPHPLVALP